MATFKASLRLPDNSTRVVDLARADDYDNLLESVEAMCSGNFRMKYTDEDGDKVTIGSTDELMYAFTECPDGLEIDVEMEGAEEQPFVQLVADCPETEEDDVLVLPSEVVEIEEEEEKDKVVNAQSVPKVESVTVEISSRRPKSEKKAPEALAEEHTISNPSEEKADIMTLGKSFLANQDFRRILASNMDTVMCFVGQGKFESAFDLLSKEAALVPALAAHPFFVAVTEPARFKIIKQSFANQMRSASNTMMLLLQAMFPQEVNTVVSHATATISVGVEASAQKSVQTETPELKSVQTETPELKSVQTNTNTLELKSVQTGPETPVLKSVQTGPNEVMTAPSTEAKAVQTPVVEKTSVSSATEAQPEAVPEDSKEKYEKKKLKESLKEIEASAKKDGFMVNVGGGNTIKWQFIDSGIPSVKYFKHGWDHNSEIRVGCRLVRINDTWLWNLTKNEVQSTWLKENGGGENTILYFMSLSKIHPCEEHHDGLKMVSHMGFKDIPKIRGLFQQKNGDMEKVVSALLNGE
eukprot:CAMPEP_0170177334 /NCGR_PEP_ID=MMETSP0040_2-20121228/9997_1 /TAXON_ID=641309 /ORGANISM="Lotharella oceanica, Strain CCMP622" /LENGTH=524 /DNA_ID=CAMNT_0010419935 /DNA_START=55 /DNA_END=1629 /DNA_ORIENTATION=+